MPVAPEFFCMCVYVPVQLQEERAAAAERELYQRNALAKETAMKARREAIEVKAMLDNTLQVQPYDGQGGRKTLMTSTTHLEPCLLLCFDLISHTSCVVYLFNPSYQVKLQRRTMTMEVPPSGTAATAPVNRGGVGKMRRPGPTPSAASSPKDLSSSSPGGASSSSSSSPRGSAAASAAARAAAAATAAVEAEAAAAAAAAASPGYERMKSLDDVKSDEEEEDDELYAQSYGQPAAATLTSPPPPPPGDDEGDGDASKRKGTAMGAASDEQGGYASGGSFSGADDEPYDPDNEDVVEIDPLHVRMPSSSTSARSLGPTGKSGQLPPGTPQTAAAAAAVSAEVAVPPPPNLKLPAGWIARYSQRKGSWWVCSCFILEGARVGVLLLALLLPN